MVGILVFSGSILMLLAVWLFGFWLREGQKLRTSGYMPPKSRYGHEGMNAFSPVATWYAGGPTEVVGLENLKACIGRRIMMVVANHQDLLDAFRIQAILKFIDGYLIAENQLNPFVAPLAAWVGCLSVKYRKDENGRDVVTNGQAVVESMVKALSTHRVRSYLIFVQGERVASNELHESQGRTGVVRAFRQVVELTGETDAVILPVGLHIETHPNQATWFHRLLRAVGVDRLVGFRCLFGSTYCRSRLVIEKPIEYSPLFAQEDAKPGTKVLINGIKAAVEKGQAEDPYFTQRTAKCEPCQFQNQHN